MRAIAILLVLIVQLSLSTADQISQQVTDECRQELTKQSANSDSCKQFISCCKNLCGFRTLTNADCKVNGPSVSVSCACSPLSTVEEKCVAQATSNGVSTTGKDQCTIFIGCCKENCFNHRTECAIKDKGINLPRTRCDCGGGIGFPGASSSSNNSKVGLTSIGFALVVALAVCRLIC